VRTQVRLSTPGTRSGVSRGTQVRWAPPGARFLTQGKGGGALKVRQGLPVDILWAPFLPQLEPYSETLFGKKTLRSRLDHF
jgi:hypothetical protein